MNLQEKGKKYEKKKLYLEGVIPLCGKIIYCKSTTYFRRHSNIMVYLLNFNITYIIILATCFDSYESYSGINFKNYCTSTIRVETCSQNDYICYIKVK